MRAASGTGSFPICEGVVVSVLIIEHIKELGLNWAGQLAQFELPIILASDLSAGFSIIRRCPVKLVVIDLDHDVGSAMALADYVAVRQSGTPVIFITPGIPWVDRDLLIHAPNACAVFGRETPPEDLAAMVARHAAAASPS